MAMDLTGISNINEYYTNHYLASIFEENAASTISSWRVEAKNSEEIRTPWSQLKEVAKAYYTIHNRYLRSRFDMQRLADIELLANKYLYSLGYPECSPQNVQIADGVTVPVHLEITKNNGAPLLWVLLATSDDKDEDILEKKCFFSGQIEGSLSSIDDNILTSMPNEDLVNKIFFAVNEPPRFIILIGMNQIALIDRNKWNEKRYLQFELNDIFSRREDTTLQAMSVLLHHDSLCPEDGKVLLDELDDNSQRHASGVSQDLKYALRESVELLGNEILYDRTTRQGFDFDLNLVDAGQLTIECVRYMYRMLFVLFIESRSDLGFIPIKEQTYFWGYSLESLRDIADSIRNDVDSVGDGYYLHETLSKLYEMIYSGYPEDHKEFYRASRMESKHDMFVIPPLKAHIFDPAFTNCYINSAKIRNSVMLKIVDLMSLTRTIGKKGSRRGRISYSNLGINQLGAVYEALLSYRGFIAKEDLYEVKAKTDKFNELDVGYFVTENNLYQYDEDERVRMPDNSLRVHRKGEFIYRLAGREREKSASYYTPEVLTRCLVKYALKELLQNKSADEILKLTVCEPAMGSAAFLNEAVNQLAEAYIDKKQKELGTSIPADQRKTELQKVKMFIADNNVYGIDLNPVAVELAEVSLWLNTIYEGGYVPWFGAQLVNGNSLIGARRQIYSYEQLTTKTKNLRWYENAPKKTPFYQSNGKTYTAKVSMGIYHFLLGDPGMCSYSDKIIKELETDNIRILNDWNKKFNSPYSVDDLEQLKTLSAYVDVLWNKQIYARKELQNYTRTELTVWGQNGVADRVADKTIRDKDTFLKAMYKSEDQRNAGAYARLKFAMDYWCSLWFWPINKADELPSRSEFLQDMEWILHGVMQTQNQNSQISFFDFENKEDDEITLNNTEVNIEQLCNMFPRLATVREISNQNKFMHWELEFAEIFADNGGFDLAIGNPPWVKLTWSEQGVLSDKNPLFAVKKLSATQISNNRIEALKDSSVKSLYFSEYEMMTGQMAFLNAYQNYPDLKGQQTDLYKCFIPTAWRIINSGGVASYIHPDGVFDDPKGGILREKIYPKLKYHFHFQNEKKLFVDIKDYICFGLNIYSNNETDSFDMICNLFVPDTIEESYFPSKVDFSMVPGIKDENDNWNTNGHPERVITVGKNELLLFAQLFDGTDNWRQAKLPIIHCVSLIETMKCFSNQKLILKDLGENISTSVLWDETNDQNNGTIVRNVHFPNGDGDVILQGPHIGVANPFFKTSRRICEVNSDYDCIDLLMISDKYVQRCNYSIGIPIQEYINRIPKTNWGSLFNEQYMLCTRKMLNISGERTLIPAIIPPSTAFINGIFGMAFKENISCVAGCFSSIPFDFMVKITGKSNGRYDTYSSFPLLNDSIYCNEISIRALLLNCLTEKYSQLWENEFVFGEYEWTKTNDRLKREKLSKLNKKWTPNIPLRTDYERRQALVEIDVLTALALGLSLEQLKTIYRIQFPVLHQYEDDTWYDVNGRIVFTTNRSLIGVGFDRKTWEEKVKFANPGKVFTKTIMDDTLPSGPVEKTIEYVAPFEKCVREKDYEIAWEYFDRKYNK